MCDERAKTRCMQCELVQWADHANCRRCGHVLPVPIVNVVERVVEKVIIQYDSQCLHNLEEASKLISATATKLQQESRVAPELPCAPGRFRVSNHSRPSMRWSVRRLWPLTGGPTGSLSKRRGCWGSARRLSTASSRSCVRLPLDNLLTGCAGRRLNLTNSATRSR